MASPSTLPTSADLASQFPRLIISNCTTIEMFEKERMKPWPYDRGWRRNLEEVFGARPLLWLLPVQDELGVGFCKSEEKQRLRI